MDISRIYKYIEYTHISTIYIYICIKSKESGQLQFEEPHQGGQGGEDGKGQLTDQCRWTALRFQPAARGETVPRVSHHAWSREVKFNGQLNEAQKNKMYKASCAKPTGINWSPI